MMLEDDLSVRCVRRGCCVRLAAGGVRPVASGGGTTESTPPSTASLKATTCPDSDSQFLCEVPPELNSLCLGVKTVIIPSIFLSRAQTFKHLIL